MKKYKNYIIILWSIFAFIIFSIFFLFFAAYQEWLGTLPDLNKIEDPKIPIASQIISSDGVPIGKFYMENRTPVKYSELPENIINALISTEDERFRNHSGIDIISLSRAIIKTGLQGGGSTITQQLAKMMFTKKPSKNIFERIIQKIKEYIISIKLEKRYSKNEIIALYLNKFDFLFQAVGIKSAAKIYFNKEISDLKIEESALLVGMAKNPSLYNPIKFPENSKKRRNVVFAQMLRNKYISPHQFDSLSKLEMDLSFKRESHNVGIATYFREKIRVEIQKWLKDNIQKNQYNLYEDGLKIYVTIDSRIQKNAEEAMKIHLSNLQDIFFKTKQKDKLFPFSKISPEEADEIMMRSIKQSDRYLKIKNKEISKEELFKIFNTKYPMKLFSWNGTIDTVMSPIDSIKYNKAIFQCGIMSTDPKTNFVKAWVGGINHKYFKFDHVKTSRRQAGSTFKPFVYTVAIEQRKLSPCYKLPNTITIFEKGKWNIKEDWFPKNSGGKYGGMIPIKEGLAKSINTITARLLKEIGDVRSIKKLAEKFGFKSVINDGPSIVLGVTDVSVFEMVAAYSTFVNKGIYTEPIYIKKIEDKHGIVIKEFIPQSREILSEKTANTMLRMMQNVIDKGTGIRLRLRKRKIPFPFDCATQFPYELDNEIAGKTGTTQNHSDGWFIGMVPNLVTGVWVGHSDRSIHFDDIQLGQGATLALPIWAIYMKKIYENDSLEISRDDTFNIDKSYSDYIDCDNKDTKDDDIEKEIF